MISHSSLCLIAFYDFDFFFFAFAFFSFSYFSLCFFLLFLLFFLFLFKNKTIYTIKEKKLGNENKTNLGCLLRRALLGSRAWSSFLGGLGIRNVMDNRLINKVAHIIRLKMLPIDIECTTCLTLDFHNSMRKDIYYFKWPEPPGSQFAGK